MTHRYTLGSLFDGSGGFPLSGAVCGIEPVWAAEVEPYPIAVTRSRFPNMKHFGDVSKVRGDEVEPVDIITFGSPCQDLSVAGKRAGLKHEENGDDETTRSGLFMEAVRIIREMRAATNGVYPTFAIWENVPGAFTSNRGEDFRLVVEELVRICEPRAVMPSVPKAGWAYADSYTGDGWSLAYRVLDAQYWGVPQRRRRIFLVADFRGGRAREILFEHRGLRGCFAESGAPWKILAAGPQDGSGANDCKRSGAVPYTLKIRSGCMVDSSGKAAVKGALVQVDKAATLAATQDQYLFQPTERQLYENHSQDSRYRGPLDVCPMLPAQLGTGGNNQPFVVEGFEAIPIHDQATRHSGKRGDKSDGKGNGLGVGSPGDPMNTLTSGDRHAVAYGLGNGQTNQTVAAEVVGALNCMHDQQAVAYVALNVNRETDEPQYIVRRLTPTECARLQGFPDRWGHLDQKTEFSDEEYRFWLNVRNTHAAINGKQTKDYTVEQMLKWYGKLHTDSAEYKMWGNGIALPCALYVMQGIQDALEMEEKQ